jgi:hypothetical protein
MDAASGGKLTVSEHGCRIAVMQMKDVSSKPGRIGHSPHPAEKIKFFLMKRKFGV